MQILGVSDKTWETIIRHATTCNSDGNQHHPANSLTNYQMVGSYIHCQNYFHIFVQIQNVNPYTSFMCIYELALLLDENYTISYYD